MSVSFQGTQEVVMSFEAGSVTVGAPVAISNNNQVSDATDGQLPVGVALHVRQGIAAVQMKGYLELPYSGTVPSLGWSRFVADGLGGVKTAADGLACLIVNVDSATQTVGLYL